MFKHKYLIMQERKFCHIMEALTIYVQNFLRMQGQNFLKNLKTTVLQFELNLILLCINSRKS